MTSFSEEISSDWQNESAWEKRLYKKKRFHKIFLQVWEILEKLHVFFVSWQSHSKISHSRPLIDFQNKENIFIVYTCDLCISMSSFKNKPLMTLDWSLKSRKHFHRYFSNCDQGKKIIRIYSFIKEYYQKYCTPQFINFNKKI